ncbi:MAG: PHP domain-containing protein [Clostridia bacterium]|nr:PHP domain-containing protein [Clostridia bacterium]
MRADLHMHSQWSDGELTPAQLLARAEAAELDCMAITDHDSLRGSEALLRLHPSIRTAWAAELSLADRYGLHLLIYGLRPAPALVQRLEALAQQRERRLQQMLDRLAAMDIFLAPEEVRKDSHGTLGRPHLAKALLKAGYVSTIQEAYDRLIGENGPAYVEGEKLTMAEALCLAQEAGWVPVLAHPRHLHLADEMLESLLDAWQRQGLQGMEVYHPSARLSGYETLERMARRRGLLVTGGSDFHREGEGGMGAVGCTARAWHSAEKDVEALWTAMEQGAEQS